MPNQDDEAFIKSLIEATKSLTKSISQSNQIGNQRRPYYTEKWGRQVGELIDLICSDGQPRLIPVGDYTAVTIKAQWYQGKDYLLDHLDPDGKYKEKYTLLSAEFLPRRGIAIAPHKRRGILAAYIVKPWRPELEIFIEDAIEGQKFERVGVGLTDEDALWVGRMLDPLSNLFVYKVDVEHDVIKVIRVPSEVTPT